jgi:hypothetical protein
MRVLFYKLLFIMADTIVNTPATQDSGAAGWVVALIVLLAVIAGGFVWYRYYGAPQSPTPASTTNTNINVTVPSVPSTTGTGATSTP